MAKLSRQRDQRRALVKGLATALIIEESITTTKPKAKTVLPYLEELIHIAKAGSLAARRRVGAALTTQEAAKKLIEDIAPRFKQRQGGYIRLEEAGWRAGDDARMAKLTLTEKPSPKPKTADKVAKDKAVKTISKSTAGAK